MPLFMRNPTKVEAFQMVQGKPFPAFIEAAIAARNLSYSLSNGMMDGSVWNQPSLAWLKFKEGDYIVHNGPHDLYVVGKDQFEKTYTAVSGEQKESAKPSTTTSSTASAPATVPQASSAPSPAPSEKPTPSPSSSASTPPTKPSPAQAPKPLAGKK